MAGRRPPVGVFGRAAGGKAAERILIGTLRAGVGIDDPRGHGRDGGF
jgi:hypothetical protein